MPKMVKQQNWAHLITASPEEGTLSSRRLDSIIIQSMQSVPLNESK